MHSSAGSSPSRRSFLKSSALSAAAVASGSLGALRAAGPVHQDGGELKIGIVGIGGRGAGAAVQAVLAHPQNLLVSAGDAFVDRLEDGLTAVEEELAGAGKKAQFQVSRERRFVGLDAIDQVLASGVDAVLLTSPPAFRPAQIEKAVAAGVHIFAEKPIAVDAPGVRRVAAACALAKQKNLSVVSGLCYRYHDGRRATVQRLHEGGIGEILSMQGNYIYGELWHHAREPQWSELEFQLRNWVYWPWLAGDIMAEQHIHTLDMMAWIQRDVYPTAAASLGGRQSRTDPKFGTVFDHFATIYEWDNGVRGHAYCRQQKDCWKDTNEYIVGTEGRASIFQHLLLGKNEWRYAAAAKERDMYQVEHDEMFAAIRAGKRIDNSDYMCKSTLMAIMGRMAAYTGQRITWEQAWNSKEVLMPEPLRFDSEPPKSEVARPGITKFV
jgi:myo-inositol 2-dehydrogenase / D-chiro-inositol 1-dehydrogenase